MFEFPAISPKIQALLDKQKWTNKHNITLNTERTKLYTKYYKEHPAQYPILKRAGALKYWCENHQPIVMDEDILVGSLGPTYRCISFYVEWVVTWLDSCVNDTDEKFREAWQTPGAVYMSDEDREAMREACAFWKDNNISAYMEGIVPDEVWQLANNGSNNTSEKGSFLPMCCKPQGHYIANFNKAVNKGFGAVKREALEKLEAMKGHTFGNDARKHTFYRAVVDTCDGAIALSKRYAQACRSKAESASPERRAELLKMADSLDWIMENPARNYWEGLQVMLFYQIMLSTDAQQHGESFGRVDQYCGHLLEKDLADGTLTKEQAQELTDAFILRASDFL